MNIVKYNIRNSKTVTFKYHLRAIIHKKVKILIVIINKNIKNL
jgi:hypothetical protein